MKITQKVTFIFLLFCCLFSPYPVEMQAQQQSKKITGVVTDEHNEPLPGVSILIQGTPRGVTTDMDGTYTIDVKTTDKLVFSYVGFESQTIPVNAQTQIPVILKEKGNILDEVTVVAFGQQKKESVIGAISSVNIADLKAPVGNLSNSLAGQLSGIVAVQRSGEPGAGSDFWIRGISTFGSNNRPLVLVDGVDRPLDLVNTEDIATFSILKDATATALYGVRGANGVILITTRKGKEGQKPIVNAYAEFGGLAPTQLPKLANAQQFMNVYNDVYAEMNKGAVYYSPEDMSKYLNGTDPDVYPNVNWMDKIYKEYTTSQRVSLNVSGGTKAVSYYVSGSYYNENGIFDAVQGDGFNPSMDWNKFNFRANIDLNLHKNTVVSLNIANQFDVKKRPDSEDIWIYTFQTVPVASPLIFSDGSLAAPEKSPNPYNLLNEMGYVETYNNNTQSLVSLNYDFSDWITKGLTGTIKYSWDADNSNQVSRNKMPSTYYITYGDPVNARNPDGTLNLKEKNKDNTKDYLSYWARAYPDMSARRTYLEASLNYNNVFKDKHRVGGLFLYNMSEKTNTAPNAYVKIFPYRYLGIAGRGTYSYADKYFAEVNFGYNGSENFSPGNRFGFFPSIAAGYLISSEDYFKSISHVIDFLKIRASYGKAGNDNIGLERRFAYNSEMKQDATGYSWIRLSPYAQPGISTGYPGNPNVTWEESLKTDLGIEMNFFHQLKFQLDYFFEDRSGIFILQNSTPSVMGVNVKPYVNSGKMENQGMDASIEYTKKFGEVMFHARGNFTYNRNKVLANDEAPQKYQYRDEVGKPLYQQFGLDYLGLFQSEEEILTSPKQDLGTHPRVGDAKYRDINNDGVIDEYDKIAIGRTHIPEINYGFGASVLWRGWDFSFLMQGVSNVTGFIDGSAINGFETSNLSTSNLFEDVALNRWTEDNPNPNAKYPRMSLNKNENNKAYSTRNQRDLSFIRIKNIEMGYTLPKKMTSQWGINSIRFYLQGFNLYTFSPFKLWDPELRNNTTNEKDKMYMRGDIYPNNRILNLGVNLKF